MRRSLKLALWASGLILLAIAGYVLKVSWYERYVWPVGPIAGMQELLPLDRTAWPQTPAPWGSERQRVEVATPQGLESREIEYHLNTLEMDFVLIPAGSYRPVPGYRNAPDKWPQRRISRWRERANAQPLITLSRPYFLGAFEVTNRQFEQFDPDHKGRRPKHQQGPDGDHHPVEPVTWEEAQRFARWLSQQEGRHYRLPTEAEWEHAAQAGTQSRLYWGEAFWDRAKANLGGLHSNRETLEEDGYPQTAPVGLFPANPWGLYDMLGNSYEWVQDWWHPNLTAEATDPQGPAEGRIRMAKGGGWTTRPHAMYSGEDDGNNPADLRDSRGFRLLVEIPE
jgi:formylglycine-generating enzyme required for sulfatase activity